MDPGLRRDDNMDTGTTIKNYLFAGTKIRIAKRTTMIIAKAMATNFAIFPIKI
jgi:hypothetical protein